MGCVYVATNEVNGKQYVGWTSLTLYERKLAHIRNAFNYDMQQQLYKAMRKHGTEAFVWKIVFESDLIDELKAQEVAWILKLDTFTNGYNGTLGGDGVSGTSEARLLAGQKSAQTRSSRGTHGGLFGSTAGTKGNDAKREITRIQRELDITRDEARSLYYEQKK